METIQITKKKKKRTTLRAGYGNLTEKQTVLTHKELVLRLKHLFRQHIGDSNAITPYDLFSEALNIDARTLSIYEREFWWNIIKATLRELRSRGELFVVNKRFKLFVLQTEQEEIQVEKLIDRHIENLKNVKVQARNWVRDKKWRTF